MNLFAQLPRHAPSNRHAPSPPTRGHRHECTLQAASCSAEGHEFQCALVRFAPPRHSARRSFVCESCRPVAATIALDLPFDTFFTSRARKDGHREFDYSSFERSPRMMPRLSRRQMQKDSMKCRKLICVSLNVDYEKTSLTKAEQQSINAKSHFGIKTRIMKV